MNRRRRSALKTIHKEERPAARAANGGAGSLPATSQANDPTPLKRKAKSRFSFRRHKAFLDRKRAVQTLLG